MAYCLFSLLSFVQSSTFFLLTAVHCIKLYPASNNRLIILIPLWLITPWFMDICYILFSIFFYSWRTFSIQFVLSLNFTSCLSQSKCPLCCWWQRGKSLRNLLLCLFLFYSLLSHHFFFALKNNFVDFQSTSNCSSAKERIFIADTDSYHLCNRRKWEWFRPALYPEFIGISRRNEEMHS